VRPRIGLVDRGARFEAVLHAAAERKNYELLGQCSHELGRLCEQRFTQIDGAVGELARRVDRGAGFAVLDAPRADRDGEPASHPSSREQ